MRDLPVRNAVATAPLSACSGRPPGSIGVIASKSSCSDVPGGTGMPTMRSKRADARRTVRSGCSSSRPLGSWSKAASSTRLASARSP